MPTRNAGPPDSSVSVGQPTQPTPPMPTHVLEPADGVRSQLSEEERGARFSAWYEPTRKAALGYGLTLVRQEADAEDLFQTVVGDLWTQWTLATDPKPFPNDERHFRATVFKAMLGEVSKSAEKVKAIQKGTTRKGELPPDTPLSSVCSGLRNEDEEIEDTQYLERIGHGGDPLGVEVERIERGELRTLLRTLVASLTPHRQHVVQVWYDNDFDRRATAEWLGMAQGAVDKELTRVRRALREELAKVERGYFEPNSPWYGVISRLVASHDAGKKRMEREAAKKKWMSPLRARVAAERQARREAAEQEARMDPEAARLLAAVEARLAALPDDDDPAPRHLTMDHLTPEVKAA